MIGNAQVFYQSSESMPQIPDGSVQSVITSPPYYNLKDYGHGNEIGSTDDSYKTYQSRLQKIWEQCWDKLTASGSLWVVADTMMDDEGNVQLIPQDIAARAAEVGFNHVETIVWYKPTSLARMNPKLLSNKKEYVMVFSKTDSPQLDGKVIDGNGSEDPAVSNHSRLGNLWRFPVKRGSLGGNVLHKAPFPVDLAKRAIRMSTDSQDIVLDPFLGSGTTAQAALELNRRVYGYEINEEFEPIIDERIDESEAQSLNSFKS